VAQGESGVAVQGAARAQGGDAGENTKRSEEVDDAGRRHLPHRPLLAHSRERNRLQGKSSSSSSSLMTMTSELICNLMTMDVLEKYLSSTNHLLFSFISVIYFHSCNFF